MPKIIADNRHRLEIARHIGLVSAWIQGRTFSSLIAELKEIRTASPFVGLDGDGGCPVSSSRRWQLEYRAHSIAFRLIPQGVRATRFCDRPADFVICYGTVREGSQFVHVDPMVGHPYQARVGVSDKDLFLDDGVPGRGGQVGSVLTKLSVALASRSTPPAIPWMLELWEMGRARQKILREHHAKVEHEDAIRLGVKPSPEQQSVLDSIRRHERLRKRDPVVVAPVVAEPVKIPPTQEEQRQIDLIRLETALREGFNGWVAAIAQLRSDRESWVRWCLLRGVPPAYGIDQVLHGFPKARPVSRIKQKGRARLSTAQRLVWNALDPVAWQRPSDLPKWVKYREITCRALVRKGYAEELGVGESAGYFRRI